MTRCALVTSLSNWGTSFPQRPSETPSPANPPPPCNPSRRQLLGVEEGGGSETLDRYSTNLMSNALLLMALRLDRYIFMATFILFMWNTFITLSYMNNIYKWCRYEIISTIYLAQVFLFFSDHSYGPSTIGKKITAYDRARTKKEIIIIKSK